MKKTLLFVALFLGLTLNACQCADKPPVGPVDEPESSARVAPAAPARPALA